MRATGGGQMIEAINISAVDIAKSIIIPSGNYSPSGNVNPAHLRLTSETVIEAVHYGTTTEGISDAWQVIEFR